MIIAGGVKLETSPLKVIRLHAPADRILWVEAGASLAVSPLTRGAAFAGDSRLGELIDSPLEPA